MGQPDRQPNIVFSSANLADPRNEYLITRPRALGELATEWGFDGVELLIGPFDWVAARERQIKEAVDDGSLVLNSFLASFRVTPRSWRTHSPDGRDNFSLSKLAMTTPLGRIVMPEVINSAAKAGRIQQGVGPRPVVLYPQPNPRLDRRAAESAGPGPRLFQANDYVAHMVGARTPEELVEKMIVNGSYDGMVADVAQMHPSYYGGGLPRVVSDLERSLPVLRDSFYAVHASLGRHDLAEQHGSGSDMLRDTMSDLANARNGVYAGTTGAIMEAVWGAPNLRYAAVEVAAGQLAEQTGATSLGQLGQEYAILGNGLREYRPG